MKHQLIKPFFYQISTIFIDELLVDDYNLELELQLIEQISRSLYRTSISAIEEEIINEKTI